MDQQSYTAYSFSHLDLSHDGAGGAAASPNSTASSPTGSLSPPGAADTAHILAIQESARLAAEEDKRRRNTAASARFRVKKKQRDQELERKAKEMADKVHDLEKKVGQLELENRWLRNLLMEKNTGGQTREERAKDGVGTSK
jgi:Skp family chaperone for outer membrane proteins